MHQFDIIKDIFFRKRDWMRPDTVIFDLDGTLLDTLDDLADSVNHALSACGMPQRTLDEVRAFVGNGVGNLIARAVPAGTKEEQCKHCLDCFRAHYLVNMENKTAPYPGTLDLLKQLKNEGRRLAVVSNKLDVAVKDLVQNHFEGLITVAVGERPGMARKPARDMVLFALEELGSDIGQAVYVGDSEVDLETAKNAGLPCISVTWGFRDGRFLLERGASHVANSIEELSRILEEI